MNCLKLPFYRDLLPRFLTPFFFADFSLPSVLVVMTHAT